MTRILRRNMSVCEKILWKNLRYEKLGFRFRRQHPVGPYVMDFYCPSLNLCIELDGEQHDARIDRYRDNYLLKNGVSTMRIPNLEFLDDILGWVEKIRMKCIELQSQIDEEGSSR